MAEHQSIAVVQSNYIKGSNSGVTPRIASLFTDFTMKPHTAGLKLRSRTNWRTPIEWSQPYIWDELNNEIIQYFLDRPRWSGIDFKEFMFDRKHAHQTSRNSRTRHRVDFTSFLAMYLSPSPTHPRTLTQTLSLSLTHTHKHTLIHTHSLTHSLTQTHTHTHTHSLTHSHTHMHTLTHRVCMLQFCTKHGSTNLLHNCYTYCHTQRLGIQNCT